jgi:hypothetical protein
MTASWKDTLETPWMVIMQDLEYMDLEGEYLQQKDQS